MRTKLAVLVLAGGCVTAGVAVGLVRGHSEPPAGTAVAGTARLFVSPAGDDGADCTASAPCRSWNAAYRRARPGTIVVVGGGRYGSQEIERRALGPPAVEFRVARGEKATVVGSVNVRSADVILDGGRQLDVDEPDRLTILGTRNAEPALDVGRDWSRHSAPEVERVTVEDVHARNLYVENGVSAVDFRMGEVGPSTMAGSNLCGDLVSTGRTDGLQVTDSLIHDNRGNGCGTAHIDAFDLNVTHAVIAGNRIWWCGTQCVFTGDSGSGLLEDNMIEETSACGGGCDAPQEVALMGTWTVRWNTIEGAEGYGREPDRPGRARIEHNLFLTSHVACDDASGRVRTRYDANVFAPSLTSRCGHATACTPTFADGRRYDGADRRATYTLANDDGCARSRAGAGQQRSPRPPRRTTLAGR